jgi:hypothetical protein
MLFGYLTTHKAKSRTGWVISSHGSVASYFLLGVIAGLLTFGGVIVMARLRDHRVITSDFWGAAMIWTVGSSVLFAAGGFVGRWFRRRGVYEKDSLPARIAERLVVSKKSLPRNSARIESQFMPTPPNSIGFGLS